MKNMMKLSTLALASSAFAASNGQMDRCAPEPAATCYADDCTRCYCLGPENYGANAPVCPKTCNGDFFIEVSGFYWNSHQDGMEYAIDNRVTSPDQATSTDYVADLLENNNLIDAKYQTPNFDWDWGFKLGVGYCMACDGWDLGVYWTWYRGKANDHVEAEVDDNHTLLPMWSGYANQVGNFLVATDIETHWKLKLNLIDIELGRNFWTSKYLSIRPHVGLRIAYIDQEFEIQHKGGSWSAFTTGTGIPFDTDAFNNEVDLENDFHGVGIRAGLDSNWHLGCGWAIYGDLAVSIVYGRFSVDHEEENRLAVAPHGKTDILETDYSFRASRAMLDLGLGLQWGTMFCDCKYEFMISLGWEQHLFFDQNQLWRVVRVGAEEGTTGSLPNNTGQNVYHHRRGDLDTQGWTLKARLAF